MYVIQWERNQRFYFWYTFYINASEQNFRNDRSTEVYKRWPLGVVQYCSFFNIVMYENDDHFKESISKFELDLKIFYAAGAKTFFH